MTYNGQQTDLPLSAEELRQWWTRVEMAENAAKPQHDKWDRLLQAYLPSENADAINSNAHFRNTEQKKALLFFQNPEMRLTPLEPLKGHLDPATGQPRVDPQTQQPMSAEDAATVHAAVLNKKLGRDGVNVARLFRSLLFDALQCSGIAVSLVAYEADLVETPMDMPGPEQPITGSVLGLTTAPTVSETVSVPVPVFEDWTWKRVSPKKLLKPHDFYGTDFDEAPWLGYKFVMPLARAKREYKLTDDFTANATADDSLLKSAANETDRGIQGKSELVEGCVIYYRPAFFGDQVANRQVQYCLVLIKGLKERPAKHQASPYQTLDERGRLTPDSLAKYPIRVLALRELSDSSWVPADAAFTDPLIKQKNTWRSQDIMLRDANIPRFLYDESIKDALDALKRASVGEGAPVQQGALMNGIEKLIAELPKLEKAMADIDGQRAIDRDIAETLAIGANQAGAENDKVISAQEVAVMDRSANARMDAERSVLVEYLLDGVRVYDTLLQRFADEDDYVEIVGRDGAKRLAVWNKQIIAGKYAYDIKPESQLRVDAAEDQKRINEFMNFHAKNPNVDLVELTKIAAQKFGLDPMKLIKMPEPPGPPPPNVSVRVAMEDLAGPAAPIALKVLQQAGYQITDEDLALVQQNTMMQQAMQAAQQAVNPEHGGPADKAELLNKHSSEETGGLPGPAVN
jgi:hypothetical protein